MKKKIEIKKVEMKNLEEIELSIVLEKGKNKKLGFEKISDPDPDDVIWVKL